MTVRLGAAAVSGAPWPGHALQASLSLHQNAPAVDALSALPAPAVTSRVWQDGGRVQGRLDAAAQTLGNVVDDGGWASDRGPACDSVESCLG